MTGAPGAKGDPGATGAIGPAGPVGPQGPAGTGQDPALLARVAALEAQVTQLSPLPVLRVGDVSRSEGNAGTTPFVFPVTLAPASAQTVTVAYRFSDGSEFNPAELFHDFADSSGTLSFAPGETNKSVTASVVGDTRTEPDEGFLLLLSAPTNATLADALGAGTIVNDDPVPTTVFVIPGYDDTANVLTGEIYNPPMRVLVSDQSGAPLAGIRVVFMGPPGEPSIQFSSAGNREFYAVTGADGVATAAMAQAIGSSGELVVDVVLIDFHSGPAAFFHLRNTLY